MSLTPAAPEDPAGALLTDEEEILIMGQVIGVFGIQGWLKVKSWTRPRANLLAYPVWLLGRPGHWQSYTVKAARVHGHSLLALLGGVGSREAAEALQHRQIAIRRENLPAPGRGEYYWSELIGMTVRDQHHKMLGRIDHLVEAGDHDVLVIRDGDHETLVPFVRGVYIMKVDRRRRLVDIDWPADPS